MRDLPSGTVTFLFTDIEGSTKLLRENRPHYSQILGDHGEILRASFENHGGREIDTQGDSFFAAFRTARDAAEAAVAAQLALAAHTWPGGAQPKVRMGMHTGEPVVSGDRYVGLAVHRAARICAAAHGGQVLCSSTTGDLVFDDLPANSSLSDLGVHLLKDFDRPERVFQLVVEGLPSAFPPPRTMQPTELPAAAEAAEARRGWWPPVVDTRMMLLLLALGMLVLVPLVAVIAGRSGGGSTSLAPSQSVAVIDPTKNEVVGSIPLGSSASSVAAFDGAIWTLSPQERTLIRIDPSTRTVTSRRGLGIVPYSLEAGNGALWITGGMGGTVAAFLPRTDEVTEPAALSSRADGYPLVAAAGDELWLGQNDAGGIARYDPRTERVVEVARGLSTPEAIVAGAEGVWVVERFDREIARFDPGTRSVPMRIPFGAPIPAVGSSTIHAPTSDALLDQGGLWITDSLEGKVWRIRRAEGTIEDTIPVGAGALAIASGEGSIWVANRADGTVSRIDPESDRVTATIKVGQHVSGIAVAGEKVWVAVP
jgi:YVTN family beta-propeller protein